MCVSSSDASTRELGEETEDMIYHTSTISETYDVFTSFVEKLTEKVAEKNADKKKEPSPLITQEIEETPASVRFLLPLVIRF